MTYKILAKTISNNSILTFKGVENYTIENGFLFFTDKYTGKKRAFSLDNVEMEEE